MTEDKGKDNLRDTIRSAMEESRASASGSVVEKEPVEEKEKVETKTEATEKSRDEAGRFAAKTDKPETEPEDKKKAIAAEPKAAEPIIDETSEPEEIKQPVVPITAAPSSWSAQVKEKWATIDPEVQQYILSRERETHKLATRMDEERNFGKQVKEATQPFMAMIQAEGATPVSAYQQFLNTAYLLRQGTPAQKQMLLQNLAKQFNVPLSASVQPVNPEIAYLEQEIMNLKQDRLREQSSRQTQESESLQSEIETFAADPSHNHFEAVKPVMASLLESGAVTGLQEAYDRACWSDPSIRSTLTIVEKSSAGTKAKVEAAKKAAVSVQGAPGTSGPSATAPSNLSLRDEIRANLRASQGRA